jgi:glucosyl-3-phosphoglycerate synthase
MACDAIGRADGAHGGVRLAVACPRGKAGSVTTPPGVQHHYADFDAASVADRKGSNRISMCFPARDEAATIGTIVRTVRRELVERVPLVDEIVVMDDGSHDETAAIAADEGAVVRRVADVLPALGAGSGKGEALWKSLFVASGEIVAWCDSDITNFDERFVVGLVGPLVLDANVDFVKGFYERPVDVIPPLTGGRTTELVARPLISILFPELATVVQPLSGEYAGRRTLLEQLPFATGYGVDLGLLVDIARRGGASSIFQVDLGTRTHRHRTLQELSAQSLAIMQTAFVKAAIATAGARQATLVLPGLDPVTIAFGERPPMIDVPEYQNARAQRIVG